MVFSIDRKYPEGFKYIFSTQAFFNFSFYGLKSIFILYAIHQLSLPEREAINLFATLMALSYGTSLAGGWVADNSLGIKLTVVLGGLLQIGGISFLIAPSTDLCFLGLALISLGSGFAKPNLSTSVGLLFENPEDPKKDKAYSSFYVAMNLGSLTAPLLCGWVSQTYAGYYASLSLSVASLIGGIYLFYKKAPLKQGDMYKIFNNSLFSRLPFVSTVIGTLLFFLYWLFKYHESFTHLMGIIALGSLIYLVKVYYQAHAEERKSILNIILYILLFTFFCSLFEQSGSSLMLFFDKVVDRNIFGIEIPSAALLSLSPIFVLICSPFLSFFFERIIEKKKSMNGLIKVGFGFLLTGFSFLLLALGCDQGGGYVSSSWVIGAIFIQTIGELLIVPIGFSYVSKVAPPRIRSLMMSFWLMAIAYGSYLSGFIAQFSLSDVPTQEAAPEHYYTFFLNIGVLPILVAITLLFYTSIKHLKLSLTKNKETILLKEKV